MQYLNEYRPLSDIPDDVLLTTILAFVPHKTQQQLALTCRNLYSNELVDKALEKSLKLPSYTYGANYSLWQHQDQLYGAGWAQGGVFGCAMNTSHISRFKPLTLPGTRAKSAILQMISSGNTTGLLTTDHEIYISGSIANHTYKQSAIGLLFTFTSITLSEEYAAYQAERLFSWPHNFLVQLGYKPHQGKSRVISYGIITANLKENKQKCYQVKNYPLSLGQDELVTQTAWTNTRILILTSLGRLLCIERETGIELPMPELKEKAEYLCALSFAGNHIFALSSHNTIYIYKRTNATSETYHLTAWPVAGLDEQEQIVLIRAYGEQVLMLTTKNRLFASASLAKERTHGLFGSNSREFSERSAVVLLLSGLDKDEEIQDLDVQHEHAVVRIQNKSSRQWRLGIFGKNSSNEQGFSSPPSNIDTIRPAEMYQYLEENKTLQQL